MHSARLRIGTAYLISTLALHASTTCPLYAGEIEYHSMVDARVTFASGASIPQDTDVGNIQTTIEDTLSRVQFAGLLEAHASYALKGQGYHLGIDYDLDAKGLLFFGEGQSPNFTSITASASYHDKVRIAGGGELSFGSLMALMEAEVEFSSENISSPTHIQAFLQVKDRNTGQVYGSINYFGGSSFDQPIKKTLALGLTYELDANRSIEPFIDFETSATAQGGSLRVRAGQTAKIVAFTFPDGTTPEEHGFTLEFDSGLVSPNIVPEPSSVLLLAIGIAPLAGRLRRRQA